MKKTCARWPKNWRNVTEIYWEYIMGLNIQSEYTLPLTVASYDVDTEDRLRLSAVLRYQQEAGERHFAPAGLGWSGLREQGMAFVAVQWHGRFLRLPAMGEAVTLTTWHRERRGARFYRCYEWRDAAGALILDGVTVFALVDTVAHRPLRGDVFDRFGVRDDPAHRTVCDDPVRRPIPPLKPAGRVTVRRSDADRNRHMNNTRYADLCEDFAPPSVWREINLRFAAECVPGEELTMAAGTLGDEVFVQGSVNEKTVFAACLQR